MARAQNKMHISVVALFAIAMVCYLIGATTTAIFFSAVGILVEIAAWFTWFAISESSNNDTEQNK